MPTTETSLLSTRYGQTCLDNIISKTADYSACLHDAQLKLLHDKQRMQAQEIVQLERQLAQQMDNFGVANVNKAAPDEKEQTHKKHEAERELLLTKTLKQSVKLANSVRQLRKSLSAAQAQLTDTRNELAESVKDNKRLRALVDGDRSAVKNYLGLVLGKDANELKPAEEKQLRALLKDDSDGQAQSTMETWDTILELKAQLARERELISQVYAKMADDACICGMSSSREIIDIIKGSMLHQDNVLSENSQHLEAYEIMSFALLGG